MQIRRFSSDLKTKVPGGHPGLYAVPVQIPSTHVPPEKLEEYTRRVNGMPLLLDADLSVVSLYFEPHASMDEHAADHPILFLVLSGQGTLRLGGSTGETQAVRAGDAVLWPAFVEHAVWTDEEALHAIVVEVAQEKKTEAQETKN